MNDDSRIITVHLEQQQLSPLLKTVTVLFWTDFGGVGGGVDEKWGW